MNRYFITEDSNRGVQLHECEMDSNYNYPQCVFDENGTFWVGGTSMIEVNTEKYFIPGVADRFKVREISKAEYLSFISEEEHLRIYCY